MPRPARVSPDRILAAAAVEFAERGFGGARVDRIARRARVNKAMLYYHFKSKQGLYRTLLRRMFTLVGERLRGIATGGGTPGEKVDRAIAGFAGLIREHAHFPAIMLREIAESGAHLDHETLAALASVPRAFSLIIEDGVAQGAFRPVHPVFAYFSTLAPIVFYLAGTPIRTEISELHLINLRALSQDQFVRHLQDAMHRSLARDVTPPS
jgi:TetR/AcrR family transcriptional regulator